MNLKKITASSLLLAGIAMSPHALAAQSFDRHTINVAFELWLGDGVSNLLEITNQKDILASDWTYPDEKHFYASSAYPYSNEWGINFNQNRIELTYMSIHSNIPAHEYRHTLPAGFHFQDIENSLPDIINVVVDDTIAPVGFRTDLVTFDADNIYVNLIDSMCLKEGGTGAIRDGGPMPLCDNSMSPTGFDNRINLIVEFAADEPVDQATIDGLYDWVESKYPKNLPTHQESFNIQGYSARFYEGTDIHIGSLKGYFYAYGKQFGGLLELGKVSSWVEKMDLDGASINQLYDWLELKYPEYLPTHQDSFYIQRYYARYYQGTNVYVGSLGGILYAYGTQFGGLLDLGELSYWVEEMKKETEPEEAAEPEEETGNK